MQLEPAAHTEEAFRALRLEDTSDRTMRFDTGVTFSPQTGPKPVVLAPESALTKSWQPK